MNKRIICIIVLICFFVQAAWAQTWTEVNTKEALNSAIANGAQIRLTSNITLSAHLTIPSNTTVTINLDGHTLSRSLTSATSEGCVIIVAQTGNLTLSNGTISGGWNSTNDGTHTAGGIVNKGTTTLTNVTIDNCKGNDGGGIMNRGTLTITGGSISNNISTNHGGGGIVNYGTVNLSGSVSITENNCHTLGGGIWSNGTLEMEGNIQVKDNTKSHSLSNNVYLKSGHVIQVTDNLAGSVIGLSMEQLGTATSGLSGNGDLSCFFSDNPIGEELSLVDGEATLALYTDRVYYIERNFNNGEVTEQVKYVTEGNYTELAGSNGNVVFNLDEDGWYVVKGSCVRQRLVAPSGRGANLILCDGATLTSLIIINEDCKLNIYAQSKDSGKIVADATNVTNKGRGLYPAGIGSEGISHMGSLEIHGGDVSAYGSKEAAGIGGGGGYLDDHEIWAPNGGYVTIYGGSVKAYGGDFAAGIGDGYPVNTHFYPDYVSTLIVYGGNVYSVGGDDAAGIGGSSNNEKGGIVKVYGGRVEAQGGRHQATYEVEYVFGAGIGGGWYGNGGDVEVYGGEIYAYGGRHAAGIGSGYNGTNYGYAMEGVHSGTLTVFGGRVEATGGVYAAGIGGGPNVSGANVTVHGGTVIGIGGEDAAGIGSGEQQSLTINGGMLTVNGGIVEAHGGNHGAGIGGGQDASGATVEINGGEVRAFGGTDAAGIGSGEEYVSGPINGGSLTVNGGTVFADGSGWGAGIGGGDDADGATVVINGGSVTAWAGEDAGNKNGCAIGSHRGDNHRGTLEIDDDMMVHAGQNPTDANAHLFPSATRVPACFYRPYAKIELCDHQGATYTINGTDANGTHTLHCTHCLVSETHTHTFVDGVCTVCGVSGSVSTVSVYLPVYDSGTNTYSYSTSPRWTVQLVTNSSFELPTPEASYLPAGVRFVGWRIGSPTELGLTDPRVTENESGLHLAGTSYTVTGDVSLTPRYKTFHVFTTTGNWNEPSNWCWGTVPTPDKEILIAAAATIPNDYVAQAVNSLTLDLEGTLTIADGGQLIHSNEGVVATVKKNITGHNGNNGSGWYFIASPTTSLGVSNTNIASNSYDLYAFNQAQEKEWVNYKKDHTDNPALNFSTLDNGKGYLYANSATFEAEFTGTLANPASGQISLDYSEANSNPNMHGWNLVGNPYPCNAYSSKPYYKMNESGTGVLATQQETTEPIPPCTGILVKANGINDNVVFTKEPQTSGTKGILDITLGKTGTRGNTVMDNAIISFKEGSELGKFYFSSQNANIYIPQDGEDYAIINAEKQGEMPLNFVAKENGTYTISVNPDGVEMNYLHLIDNMTGADVDLLALRHFDELSAQGPASYTFTAKTTDYASRFKLVFSTNGEDGPSTGSGTFAFIDASGNIIVNGEGVLQVVDVMGRIIISTNFARNVSTSGMTPGVYVLRLIDENDVRTQKIVIK